MTFNSARLRIGRLFHGLTQRELAQKIAVANGLIADFENDSGIREPRADILEALCLVLEVEPEYFTAPTTDEFLEGESNFRRRIKATERLKRQVLAQASLFGMVVQELQQYGTFPAFNFPDLPANDLDDVERVAEECRIHWRLGTDARIENMTYLIENAGAVILSVDLKTAEHVDAFSRFGNVSVVVLNAQKDSPSRTLFDMAHEVGHGVLHQHARGLSLDRREDEADRFAGAFLLPRHAFATDFVANHSTGWDGLIEMKRYWRTSLAAIIRRAYQLQLIDAIEYRTRFRELGRYNWRTDEPEEPVAEQPVLFRAALDRAWSDYRKTARDIAHDLYWKPELFEKATGVPIPVDHPTGKIISLADRRRVAAG